MHAVCIPDTPDHVSDLIGINYLNSFYDELSNEMMRQMDPGWTAHRMNAIGQTSNKNIIVISEFFSTSYLACAMPPGAIPDLRMLHHVFDFIGLKGLKDSNSNQFFLFW